MDNYEMESACEFIRWGLRFKIHPTVMNGVIILRDKRNSREIGEKIAGIVKIESLAADHVRHHNRSWFEENVKDEHWYPSYHKAMHH